MSSNIHPFYSHSGKFGPHGPIVAVAVGGVAAIPLGIIYSYLIKWIPFIYLNFLATAGYGLVFGFLAALFMKWGKVRNAPVALLSSLAVGLLAWYGSWSGFAKALFGSQAPWFLTPHQLIALIKVLYNEGSWGIGMSSSQPVSGIPLAIIWLVEGAAIVGITTFMGYGAIARTPYCELHECWLGTEKKMDKLDVFTQPDQIAAFKAGDIAPLEQSRPRVPASGRFARLTLKHSDQCHDYCALSISNITVTPDKNGNPKESAEEIISNLWVPKSMFDYLTQFDRPTAKATAGV